MFNIKKISYLGLYLAFILIMGLTPAIGFLPLPGITIALILVPIIICSIHLGALGSLFSWLVFGLTSFIAAYYMGSALVIDLAYNQTIKWFFISFISRIMIGFILALLNWILKEVKLFYRYLSITFSAVILNTFLFVGFLTWMISDVFLLLFFLVFE